MERQKLRMSDVIILLPGITGSVLQKKGIDLWAPSLEGVSRSIVNLGLNLKQLRLNGDDFKEDDLNDGVQATRLINDATLIPGFMKIDGYTKISKMITGCFDVIKASTDEEVNDKIPANYFEFPYDWRRDNRVASRLLEKLINRRLNQWRETCNPKSKVILIAHSMGGLIARYYLEAMDGWEKCKALITFGTPHRGSLKALNYLANGYQKFWLDLTEVLRSFTSIYQLLPIYESVKVDGAYRRVTELDIPGVDHKRAHEALAFHYEIINQVNAHRKDSKYLDRCYVNLPVVGTYQPTLQSAELFKNELTVSEQLPDKADKLLWHGDGTVPYLSAVPHELSKAYRSSFYAESHGSLQSNDQVLNFVYDQLSDMQVDGLDEILGPKPSSSKRKQAAISMKLEDLYFVDEPVIISARILEDGKIVEDIEGFRKHMIALVATIKPIDSKKRVVKITLEQVYDAWLLRYEGLGPGVYRVELRTSHRSPLAPYPVHDLFQVVERN